MPLRPKISVRHGSALSQHSIVRLQWSLILLLTSLLCAAPLRPCQAEVPRGAQEKRLESVKQLPEKEREQLADDFRRFMRLPSEKQQELQHLQTQIDEAADPSLREVMTVYSTWLKSLTPEEREELKQIKNTDSRLQRIRELVSRSSANVSTGSARTESPSPKNDSARDKPRNADSGKPDRPLVGMNFGPLGPRGRHQFLNLPADDFLRAIGTLERQAAPTFDKDQRRILDSQQGYLRHVKLMEILMRLEINERGTAPRWAQDPKVIEELITGISDKDVRQFMQNAGNVDRKRHLFLFSVAVSLHSEFEQNHRPSDAKLVQFMETQPADVQDQIKSMSKEEKKRLIYQLYVMSHPQEFPPHVLQFQRGVQQFVQKTNLFNKGLGKGDGRPFRRRVDESSNSEFKPRRPENAPDGKRPPANPEN
jgi:hypothetical protein